MRERLWSATPRLLRRRRLPASPQAGLADLLERLNPPSLARATGHRVILNRHLTALGMPVPRLHGVIGRDGGWSAEGGRPVAGAEQAARFLAGLPGDLALRPYDASLRVATRLLRRDGDGLADDDGCTRSPAEVAAQVLADPACVLFVVQERVAVDALLRLTTFLGADGAAQVVHACRVGPGGDLEEIAVDAADAGARATAYRAAALLAPQRSIAWEVATTAGGARILDADSRYAPVAGPLFAGAVRAMEGAA